MTREEAIARIKEHKIIHKMNEPRAIYISEALDMAIKALEQEPCEDAISRQEVLYLIADDDLSMGQVVKGIHALPSVTPQPRKGHWVEHNTPSTTYYDCSLCGCVAPCTEFADSYLWKLSNFCPDCGADMREVEE